MTGRIWLVAGCLAIGLLGACGDSGTKGGGGDQIGLDSFGDGGLDLGLGDGAAGDLGLDLGEADLGTDAGLPGDGLLPDLGGDTLEGDGGPDLAGNDVPLDGAQEDGREDDAPWVCNPALDADCDGFDALAKGGDDCNDDDDLVNPAAADLPLDGVDQDCSGTDATALEGAAYLVFVDAANGDDAAAGTPQAPVKTLAAALALAVSAGKDLILAAGDYQGSLTLDASRRLFGGFQAGTWARDPAVHQTRVLRTQGSTFVLKVSAGTLLLDGLEVSNGVCSFALEEQQIFEAILVLAKAGLVLRNCKVHGGTNDEAGVFNFLRGVQLEPDGQALIEDCQLYGGISPGGTTFAVAVGRMGNTGKGAYLRLHRSFLDGGEAKHAASAVVVAFEARAELVGNLIWGGKTSGDIWAVEAAAPSTLVAINNTIYGGEAPSRAAAFNSSAQAGGQPGDFTFVNNILEGGTGKESWCLTAHSNSTVRLVGNNLHGNGTVSNCAVGRWSNGLVCVTFDAASVNNCTTWTGAATCLESRDNLVGVPGLEGLAGKALHLVEDSPMIDAGQAPEAYLDSPALGWDFDGQPRPAGGKWDIGGDER